MKHLITGLIAVAFLSAGCGGDEKKLASETSKKAETAAGAYCTYRCGGRRFEYTRVTYDTSAR